MRGTFPPFAGLKGRVCWGLAGAFLAVINAVCLTLEADGVGLQLGGLGLPGFPTSALEVFSPAFCMVFLCLVLVLVCVSFRLGCAVFSAGLACVGSCT